MNRIDGGAAGARLTNMLGGAAVGLLLAAGVWGVANAQPAPGAAADHNAAAATQVKKQNIDPDDKVICRYEEETGTLLGGHKICHTKRQWEQLHQDAANIVNNTGRSNAWTPSGPGPGPH